MKTLAQILAASTFAALAVAGAAQAQTTQSAQGSIAVVSPQLVVTKTADLNFGTVTKPGSGSGTVTIGPSSDTPTPSNVTIIGTGQSRAAFTISGLANANVSITLGSPMTLTRSGGSETLTVPLQASTGGTQLNSSGSATVYVGGSVTLQSTTVNGAYSGTFNVTAAYN